MNRRILIVDDQLSLHEDYAKALASKPSDAAMSQAKAAFFGDAPPAPAEPAPAWQLSFASQGQEALALVEASRTQGQPFALAFVDMRMPPGWDGVETIERLWAVDADLEVVICTAFADYSLEQIQQRLDKRSQLLILKKPFDLIEVQQLASALSAKWDLVQAGREQIAAVRKAEAEARAYAASLGTINSALTQAKLSADSNLKARNQLLERLSAELATASQRLLGSADQLQQHGARDAAAEVQDLERELSVMAQLALLSASAFERKSGDCELAALLDATRAFAHGPIPERIPADPDRMRQLLGLLRDAGGTVELEYRDTQRLLCWRWRSAGAPLEGTREALLQALCRVLSIERELTDEGLELCQALGDVDVSQLVLHPQSPLPSSSPVEESRLS
jgi:CheY-like chemotaxis protein